MEKRERKYIYINNLDFGGTVFQTQILDWLSLYKAHNLDFSLIQTFHVKDLKRPGYLRKQLGGLRKSTELYAGSVYLFPSKSFFYFINAFIIFFKIVRYVFRYKEVLIFSRAILGKEILFLRKISPAKIVFHFDGRAAAAEENKYVAALKNDFSLERYIIIANTYYLVYQTLLAADKIFVVSNVLKKYFQDTYNLHHKRFIPYPCLSDSRKFYHDPGLRNVLRAEMGIQEGKRVFIYSGGIDEWHIAEKMFTFISCMFKREKDLLLLCLTKNRSGLDKIMDNFPELKLSLLSFSVPNKEVYRYLNAADYGILFRENTIMNNVASPSKFAEYILCGLPVLISEGVGDYSNYTIEHGLGVLIRQNELNDPEAFDINSFLSKRFDRAHIAEIGRKHFSKESSINRIIAELES